MTALNHRLPNGAVPVLLSADAADLLSADAAALLTYTSDHPQTTPQAIADMLFRTRIPRRHRALCMVDDRDSLMRALRALVDGTDHPSVVRTTTPAASGRVGFVFPGQGSQRPGMGRLFYESVPAYREEAGRCAAAFEEQFGHSPLNYLLDEQSASDDSASTAQPALFTHMAALAAMWRSFGITPDVTIGHSQGEIAAAYVAKTMTLTDAVHVVGIRARAVDDFALGDYAMAVVAMGRDECEDAVARCDGWVQLSVVNSPTMVAISGDRRAIEAMVDAFTERGVFTRVIRVRYPAHTALMTGLGERLRHDIRLADVGFLDSETVCIGATLGAPITNELPADLYWYLNLRNPVRFDRAIAAAAEHEVDLFVELTEHPALQLAVEENLATRSDDHTRTVIGTSVRTAENLDEFTRSLAAAAIHVADFPWAGLGEAPDRPAPLPLLDFPNTAMRSLVSWLPYTAAPPTVSKPPTTTESARPSSPGAPPRLLTEQWNRLSQRTLMPPRSIGIVDHTASFDVGALCSAAGDIGASARPVNTENDCDTADIDTVVILVPPSATADDSVAAADVATFFGERTWWPGLDQTVTNCWLVTIGGEAVVDGDAPPDLVSAAAAAGFRSVGAEHAGVGFRHLDLPAGVPPAPIEIITALHTDGEPELAVRDGVLYAKRVVEHDPPGADSTAYEHVLVVGGTGTVGLEVCDHLARQGVRRITLVNRSGETAAVANRLRRIRAAAPTVIEVVACDIGDSAAVARLAEQNRYTPADLIVHAAVVFTGNELADITVDAVRDALRAKVIGAWHILETFPRTDACRVVLCSSIGATVGGRGLIAYAAANRMLDAMARRRRAEGLDCVAVQWGHWAATFDPEAEHTTRLGSTGLVPMAADGALAIGLAGLSHNAIVAAFDLERARSVLDICGRASLLAGLRAPVREVQAPSDGGDLPQRFLQLLAHTIGVDGVESIDTTLPLVAIGLDSLQALEIRRRVKTEFDHDLEVSQLLGGASISDLLAQLTPAGH